ncbi:MAG TPA: adenylate/guanylate cyclase domain-containing protein [Gaiellaceae bacterium]|nr:adenylate/guanylate cyclase domain-containing protein [Gaiellaceae bacterium]
MQCPTCSAENRADAKFCGECGAAFGVACPSCGTGNEPGRKFCFECGSALTADATAAAAPAPAPTRQAPAAERRLVSVLFADLVGFTSASEGRDAEETRELLSRYFELARTLIARYGGTVEKFIGDAVMAVWGTPTATEDDAERAVRAALDLVASVPELDPALQARVGVLTGEAAVTLGAEGEGMVAGDLVNTASRVQAAAEPGTVLVGESTRRSTEQAIAYEASGSHELKGKTEPMPLFRALRVVSGVGGQLRSAGLEAPFVGRERELKLIKDLFHSSAENRRAHLASVSGIAGIGKSRLSWEFYKYFDGIVDTVWWHRGRCLAYGEGVAYWALADMVRMRCRIAEDEQPESARKKISATLLEHILDDEERAFVEPRIAHLLGLEERTGFDRQDLFAAWRLFFERLADSNPTVLAFEDMQWADTSLLEFIEYLLEWSRDHPIFVITLARPELQERHPGWGAGQRNFTSLYLEPLSHEAMVALLDGLVPGLPEALRDQILARAEGVPLYAVETVRMLLDRGLLSQDGPVYRPTGEIETLEVPETLHALIAARLDGLSTEERRLLQDGSVLGKTFTARALAALSDLGDAELEPLLQGLVRKEVLGIQSDPRSPEHGQYGFLQDLVRHVAYETLSKRERKTRHLTAAQHLERAFADLDEVAEVLASHYLAAVEAAPDAEDAGEIRTKAREMLARAGERAESLGAPEEGQRYFDRAASLADDGVVEAELLERAGRLAFPAGRPADARERLERAIGLFRAAGDSTAAARASVALCDVDVVEGRLEEALTRLGAALPALEQAGAGAELAATLAALGRMEVLRGGADALSTLEQALRLAEKLRLEEVFVQALTSKALALMLSEGRLEEARVLLDATLERARVAELHQAWFRIATNLGVLLQDADRHAELIFENVEEAEAKARQLGDREQLAAARLGVITSLFLLGLWDEALVREAEVEQLQASLWSHVEVSELAAIRCEQGRIPDAERIFRAYESAHDAEQADIKAMFLHLEARILRARGRDAEALGVAERGFAMLGELAVTSTRLKRNWVEALEAAFALGDVARIEELLAWAEALQPGEVTPFLAGHRLRFRARLDAWVKRPEHVEASFRTAIATFREFSLVFYLAVTQLELAEWLAAQGRPEDAQPLLEEAGETFERLEAKPWLERLEQTLTASVPSPART